MAHSPEHSGGAVLGALLFGGGLVGGNALVRIASVSGADDVTQLSDPGTYRLSAVATVAAACGVLLLSSAAARAGGAAAGDTGRGATASGGVAAAALLLMAGVRYAAPDLAQDAPDVAVAVTTAATSACAFAAFVAIGVALLVAPGPAGSVRVLGRAAGGCCLAGPLVAAVVSALDAGAGYGVALTSTGLGVLLVTAWGLALARWPRP